MCDSRMAQPRENVAFAAEPLFASASDERHVEQLDCGAALEPSVTAFREPDAAGAALAERRDELVRAEHLPCERRAGNRLRIEHGALQEARLENAVLLRQNRLDVSRERRVLPRQRAQPG